MCGIAGIYLKNPEQNIVSPKQLEDMVDWLFCGIEHRGTHATGIAVQNTEGEAWLEKSDMPAGKFIFWRRDIPDNPRTILMHTRLATQGKPENLLNNHPIEYKNIMAIHNGHISNDDELFKDEELDRIAQVDSEIIPALLHKHTFHNVKDALEKFGGGFAIAAFDSENPGTLLLAKGSSSPLVYLETSDMWIWASEQNPIITAMEHGLGWEVKPADLKELKYGEYLLIEDEMSIKEDFQPYFKKVTYTSSWDKNTTTYPRSNYSDGWKPSDQTYGRDQCDECFVWVSDNKLTQYGKDRICDHCEKKMFDIDDDGMRKPKNKKLSRKERKRLRKEKARRFQESKQNQTTIVVPKESEGISKALDNEHWVVCQLVAEHFGTNATFVDFMLFSDQDVADFEDPNLVSMFLGFEDKYNECLEEVRGETDAVIETMCNVYPIGF